MFGTNVLLLCLLQMFGCSAFYQYYVALLSTSITLLYNFA